MDIDEVAVYVTSDGLGRAAIVRRRNGLLCIYEHWLFGERAREALSVVGGRTGWLTSEKPTLSDLYGNVEVEPDLYGTLDDAQRQVRSRPGFSEALLISTG
jgi:hypothetical protein